MNDLIAKFSSEVLSRLERLSGPHPAIDEAITVTADALEAGGVVQAFGTGHSEAFAMEIAGRAGGLIATNRIPLRTLVLRGGRDISVLGGAELERDNNVANDLLALYQIEPNDVFMIASNSGVNGSIVGVALAAKERGHKVIAVTSLEHTNRVQPKHPSGKRLSEIADITIDNLAPYG
ncbi:MAG TPA: sugar isomerase domain-containing protein, partial [Devosia sp.]|nr:sugar isomerase domain-containing protein [Devosia sp.]